MNGSTTCMTLIHQYLNRTTLALSRCRCRCKWLVLLPKGTPATTATYIILVSPDHDDA